MVRERGGEGDDLLRADRRAGQACTTDCDQGCAWPSAKPAQDRQRFYLELLAICEDPEVRKFARRRAGDRDLAEDALQEAFCAVAGTADPQHIIDLRAYFCRVLIRAVYSLHGQLRAIAVEDPEILTEMRRPWSTVGAAAYPRPFEEATVARLAAQARLERFLAQRERLRMRVPGRSSDPGRYRDTILAVAEHLLREAMTGGLVSQADSNESLRAAYPDWFGPPGCAANTCHKRLSRARTDVQELLKAVIRRDELLP